MIERAVIEIRMKYHIQEEKEISVDYERKTIKSKKGNNRNVWKTETEKS